MMKINNVKQLNDILSEWILKDTIPEEQIVEVPLYVIKQFMHKVQDDMYLSLLKDKKVEIEKQIRRLEHEN